MSSSEVVVVGGGVIGCSVALHLLEAGVRDTILVERDDVAQATSNAGAGFIGEWAAGWDPRLGPEELTLERYGLRYYQALADLGADFGHRSHGNLYVAPDEASLEADCIPLMEGVPDARRLTADEVGEISDGFVDVDSVAGGVLHPSGAQVSAGKAARALARRYRDLGGRLLTRQPVQRILVEHGRVRGVETNGGTIACERVVLAAGAWSNMLLRPLGGFLPYVPLVAFRVVTEPIGAPRTLPTLMMRRPGFYAREEAGGLLWGATFSAAPRHAFVATDPPERFDQLPLDGYVEVCEQRAATVARVLPAFAQARSSTVAFGAPTYTPDGRALVGPLPGVEGLFVASGCNEGGVTHGPGLARLISELIVDGTASLCPAEPFAPGRFGDRYDSSAEVAVSAGYAAG